MTITLEAIRAAGGIVHSDGNIFFRDISMLQGLAGAAPAAVAGPAMDVTLDEDQAGLLRDMLGDREAYPEAITVRLMVGDGHSGHGLYVAQAEYQDEGAVLLASLPTPAAPALEAPAAPAGDLALIVAALENGQPQMAHYAEPRERHAQALAAARRLAAAPQAPAAPSAGNWIAAEEVDRLVRDLDVALHGESDAAAQASLCDIVGLTKAAASKLGRPVLAAPAAPSADEREAFEAWIKKDGGDLSTFGSGQNRHYNNSAVNNAWTGWSSRAAQAAPAAPVVAPAQGDPAALLQLAEVLESGRSLIDIERKEAAHALRLQATAAPAAPAAFQQRVQPWLMECFGPVISADKQERNHRFLEEALETVQAAGCTASEAHQLVDYVFGRPVGELGQEVGGAMTTLAALCLANGIDMHAEADKELARVWTMVEKIRAKQAAKPKHSPLPAAPAAPAVDADPMAEFLRDTGPAIVWPKARDVGRIGDMSPSAHLRIGLDSDNDVYASIYDEHGGGSIEFCTPGQGGGKSSRTRMALLAVMVAMEADNAADPGRDWWAERNGAAQAKEGGAAA